MNKKLQKAYDYIDAVICLNLGSGNTEDLKKFIGPNGKKLNINKVINYIEEIEQALEDLELCKKMLEIVRKALGEELYEIYLGQARKELNNGH